MIRTRVAWIVVAGLAAAGSLAAHGKESEIKVGPDGAVIPEPH
jgi:hypothetical protein